MSAIPIPIEEPFSLATCPKFSSGETDRIIMEENDRIHNPHNIKSPTIEFTEEDKVFWEEDRRRAFYNPENWSEYCDSYSRRIEEYDRERLNAHTI